MTTKLEQIGRIAAQHVEAYQERVRGRASHMVHDLEAALGDNPEALALVEQIASHLAELGPSQWAEVPPAAGYIAHHRLRAWQTVLDIWLHANDEGDGDELEHFLDALRYELEPNRDELVRALSACTEIHATLVTSDLLSPWPFEAQGSVRDLAEQANATAAAALDVPPSTLPAPEDLFPDDIEIIDLADRVCFAGLLPNLLDEQRGWAEILVTLAALGIG